MCRVLVVKRDKLGDMLLTTPLIKSLADAGYKPDVLSTNYNSWVLNGNSNVHAHYVLKKKSQGFHRLHDEFFNLILLFWVKRKKYDWVIVANGEYSSRAVGLAKKVQSKKTKILAYLPANMVLPSGFSGYKDGSSGSEAARICRLALLMDQGIVCDNLKAQFIVSEEMTNKAKSFLLKNKIEYNDYVVFSIGARKSKRQPTAEQVIQTSSWLHSCGVRTILIWTPGHRDDPLYPGDDELADSILRKAEGKVVAGKFDIETAIGVMAIARTSVVPDSGLMHFAACTKGGVIGLFAMQAQGAPSVEQWTPIGARVETIVSDHEMSSIPTADIINALVRFGIR